MEPIEKTVVETTIAGHIKSKLSTTISKTMENAVHKEATPENSVTSSVEATVTETVEEISKVEDIDLDGVDYDEDDIALMVQQEEEEAAAKRKKIEQETAKTKPEFEAETVKSDAKVKPEINTDDTEPKDDEPKAAAVATATATATKTSLSSSSMADAASEDSEYTTPMDTEPEEKEKNRTSLASPPPPNDTATGVSGKKKEYPPRKTRGQSQEAHQKPTNASKKSSSEHATSTPAQAKSSKKSNSAEKQSSKEPETVVEDDDEKEEEDDDEPEYEVEKIEGHRIYKGKVVKYEIKWKGYPQEDNTMEAASTIHDDVPELCIAYWDSLTNVPRPSNTPVAHSTVPASNSGANTPIPTASKEIKLEQEDHYTTIPQALNKKSPRKRELEDMDDSKISKRIKQYVEHVPNYMIKLGYQFPTVWPLQTTSWEDELRKICVQASPLDSRFMLCYIEWLNDQKTIHTMDEVHEKIPIALIQYYEERLQFV